MEGDKVVRLDNNQNIFTLPMMRELAQTIVFMKIYGQQNQAQAEKYKLCYQIQDADKMRRLNKISDCFKQYKSDYQKLLDKFNNAKETLSQIKRDSESKKCNCYSLVSESEMDACIWEFDQAYLKKSADFLKRDLVKTLDSCRGRVLKLPKIKENRNRSQLRTISVKPQEQKTTFNDSEEFSGRSTSKLDTSKLDSSILFKTRRQRASIRPIQIMSMRTQQTCDITAVVAVIQQGPIRTSIKNLRITREQLQLYLCKFYPQTIAESILRIFKAPQLFSYQKYQQWVDKINKLDDEQSIRCVFQIYDFNQQGYITTSTIWDLLSKDYHSQAIEYDIFYLVSNKQVKDQLLKQGDPIIQNEKPNYSLPASILGSKLKQSLQIQRRFTISPENRPRLQSKTISAGRSIDFTLEDDSTKKELQKLKFKKHQMITQIQVQQITDEDQKSLFIPNSKKEMKRLSCIKCSIDINTFTEIWYPQRPQLYEDIIRRLTSIN